MEAHKAKAANISTLHVSKTHDPVAILREAPQASDVIWLFEYHDLELVIQ